MKTTVRIAALVLLIVLSALASGTGASSVSPSCFCIDIYDPYIDATKTIFPDGCYCQCLSTQPATCKPIGKGLTVPSSTAASQ